MNITDKEIIQLIAEALNCSTSGLTPESGLGTHYEWDSLGHVNIMVAIEKKYGIEINDSNIEKLMSVMDIKKFLEEHAS